MNQPQGPWGQPPQGGYPQQGYGQQAPQPYGQPQQGGYSQGPPPGFGGPPAGAGGGGYDFGQLYGTADMSANLVPADRYPAVVEDAEWGRTKDGTKGAWTIVFRTTAPGLKKSQGTAGSKFTMTLSVNPTKQDGTPNPQGMGIMFRQLGALGVPIPPAQPFWELGWTPDQVAQAMKGRPCTIQLIEDEYDGVTRNKVRDIQPPTPGAPTAPPQQAQQQAAGAGYPQNFAQPPQGQPYGGQQAPQPWNAPQGQDAYGNQWHGQQQGGPPPGYGQQPQQGVPGYAQPAQPGQPGMGQFTPQGQAVQPGTHPGHDQMAQQGPPQGYPQQGPPPGQNGYPAQPQGQQQGPPQQGDTPAPPPWAQ